MPAPAAPQVKLWAKAHGLNDPMSNTLNSWCLLLLAAFTLQSGQPALLPSLATLLGDGEVRLGHAG